MDFKSKLFLAPMAGFTDAPMRRLCHRHGCDITVSEMVSARAMGYKDEKTGVLARITEGEGNTVIQLFGHDPESLANACKMVADGSFCGVSYAKPPFAVDINMGCPVKKIFTNGDGSALMKNPKLCGEIAITCKKALEPYNLPLTVKIRSGWDKNSINAPEVAKVLVQSGVDCIAVHARTRDQMYAPSADLSVIKAVRDAVPADFPLVGNGDIISAEGGIKMLRETGCDSLMIGRGALGNPWIFEEIKCALDGKAFTQPTVEEKIMEALQLVFEITEEKGEDCGVREARGRVAHFIKGIRGSAAVRDKINHATTYKEIESILQNCLE